MSNNPQREEILRRIDLASMFQKAGGKIPPGAHPNADGWLPVHSIDRKDKRPSAAINVGNDPNKRGIYVDAGGVNRSFFDLIAVMPGPFMTGKEVYMHYGRETGVFNGGSPSSSKKSGKSKNKFNVVATYDYHDAAGNLAFQACRLEPKDFRLRRPDGAGGWIWNMTGVPLVPYHLPDILSAALVYIDEGEKDCDRMRAMGLVATCNPMGAGKWRKEFSQYLRGKVVVLLPDNDPAGRAHVQDMAQKLYGIVASLKIMEIPGLPEKGDVSDWLDAGGTIDQLRTLMEAAPEWTPATASPPPDKPQETAEILRECGHTYSIKGGRHSIVLNMEGGVEYRPLCNFTAQITDEVTRDDGLRVTKEFAVSGNVAGLQLPSARVPTKDFDAMKWVREGWGAAASITPTRNNAAHLPNAILTHSRTLGITRKTLYGHTGWREINGVWRYLHGGGAIGPGEPVAVDLGENLRRYRLPEPGGIEAAQASLRFLDICPWEVTAPLIACTYLAPFADLLKVDFSLWLHGPTGAKKSTLAALALAHYGDFTRLSLPGSWFSTVNSLEKLCFVLKDCLVVIDDFAPAASAKDANKMSENAGRLIYQAGNRSGRGRLTSDLSARPDHYPRSLIISTAEMLLPGKRQSATARYLAVEMDPNKSPLDRARLTAAQAEAHLYAGAMAAYLEDLAPRLNEVQDEIRELFELYRGVFYSDTHGRIPEIQSWLAVGFEFFLRFQMRMGAITDSQKCEMEKRAWRVWEALGEKHSRIIQGERPTLKFLAILEELFTQKRIYVESTTVSGAPPQRKDDLGWERTEPARNAELVGWADNERLYLMPEATYRVVAETISRQGDFLALGKNEMIGALVRERLIEPAKDGNTKIKSIRGSSKRVIVLPHTNLFCDEEIEVEK
ncbi:MAG: DUF927 domain-containing protein [Deltaproteobacteria bacterium]|nr:DUF927 domain-containing protein [Deltaproteobacteria bacterium]